ncbi:hypothetical protein SETIT_9G257800v2 [Setaria italica]|uniref:Uncharacterized protein n=1 Tax=Setaria italica TaxID=4555 RepID=A0A368SKT6_SETIT|nr:hypothetical protein SETIT_9G257800v2 [Setaria italica]
MWLFSRPPSIQPHTKLNDVQAGGGRKLMWHQGKSQCRACKRERARAPNKTSPAQLHPIRPDKTATACTRPANDPRVDLIKKQIKEIDWHALQCLSIMPKGLAS